MKKLNRKFICIIMSLVMLISGICPVMSKTAEAKTGEYVVKINKQQNCVTVYKTDKNGELKPVKAMICSTGYATPVGTFPLGQKMRWHTLMGPCYGQYCSRITGGILFHSVWYYRQDPSTISVSAYNKLGTTASHGCVRLTVADAKWIYDNVPSGSKIVIYNSSDPGPLGKPKAVKLSGYATWDPTDIWSSGNPWNKHKPQISGVKNREVKFGNNINILKGVTATNTLGNDATKLIKTEIKYRGNVVKRINTKKTGIYKVKYYLTDEAGKFVSKIAKIYVKAKYKKPNIKVASKIYVDSINKVKKSFALQNAKITQNGKKLADKYVNVKITKINKNTYKVTYTACRESLVAKATTIIVVREKQTTPDIDIEPDLPATGSAVTSSAVQ
ncbi:MAG: L,D-transpeptidase family protein [Lachnospiraceae bacterium]|nr:L,D-transpeptidase family protein [Lachnospiraceae bacterium]